MSFQSPGPNIHRGFNLILGALSDYCDNGPLWTLRAGPGITLSRRLEANSTVALSFGDAGGGSSAFIGRTTNFGLSWAAVDVGAGPQDWASAAFGNGVWVLVAGFVALNATCAVSSDNGATWTPGVLPVAGNFTVTFANGQFVAVDRGAAGVGVNTLFTSPDGVTWTPQTIDRTQEWLTVAFNPQTGTWVLLGDATPNIVVSTSVDNCVTWTPQANIGATNPPLQRLTCYVVNGAGVFCLVQGASPISIRSSVDDGVSWQNWGGLGRAAPWSAVIFGGGVFMTANGGNELSTSRGPGVSTWRDAPTTPPRKLPVSGGFFFPNVWNIATFGDGRYVGVLMATASAASGVC